MNTYKITFTNTETNEQKTDNFTDPTEREARKSFKECYRHATYTIDSVELIADNAPASKKHERDALETIKKIVEGLGPDSYLATAFAGCFQDAEENIENDFAMSMSGRWQYAEEQLETKKAEIETLKKALDEERKDYEAAHEAAHQIAAEKQVEVARGLWDAVGRACVPPKWWHLYKHAKKARVRKKYGNRIRRAIFCTLAAEGGGSS